MEKPKKKNDRSAASGQHKNCTEYQNENIAAQKLLHASWNPSLGSWQRRNALYGAAGIADPTHGKGNRSWSSPEIENGTLQLVCQQGV